MVRNKELKTVSKVLSSAASGINIGGQVPTGMKRWVTFIALDSILKANTESLRVWLASVNTSNPQDASMIATTNMKMVLDIRASKAVNQTPDGVPLQIPAQPNTDKPLFSIGGGKWLGAYASVTSGNLFVQYYDE